MPSVALAPLGDGLGNAARRKLGRAFARVERARCRAAIDKVLGDLNVHLHPPSQHRRARADLVVGRRERAVETLLRGRGAAQIVKA